MQKFNFVCLCLLGIASLLSTQLVSAKHDSREKTIGCLVLGEPSYNLFGTEDIECGSTMPVRYSVPDASPIKHIERDQNTLRNALVGYSTELSMETVGSSDASASFDSEWDFFGGSNLIWQDSDGLPPEPPPLTASMGFFFAKGNTRTRVMVYLRDVDCALTHTVLETTISSIEGEDSDEKSVQLCTREKIDEILATRPWRLIVQSYSAAILDGCE